LKPLPRKRLRVFCCLAHDLRTPSIPTSIQCGKLVHYRHFALAFDIWNGLRLRLKDGAVQPSSVDDAPCVRKATNQRSTNKPTSALSQSIARFAPLLSDHSR